MFHRKVVRLRLTPSPIDSRMYIYKSDSAIFIQIVEVDDLLVSSDSIHLLEDFKAEIKRVFQVKLLGEAKSFIALEMNLEERLIMVRKKNYIAKIVKEYGFSHCNAALTLLPLNVKLSARGESERACCLCFTGVTDSWSVT